VLSQLTVLASWFCAYSFYPTGTASSPCPLRQAEPRSLAFVSLKKRVSFAVCRRCTKTFISCSRIKFLRFDIYFFGHVDDVSPSQPFHDIPFLSSPEVMRASPTNVSARRAPPFLVLLPCQSQRSCFTVGFPVVTRKLPTIPIVSEHFQRVCGSHVKDAFHHCCWHCKQDDMIACSA
jgi:hypothetical protein